MDFGILGPVLAYAGVGFIVAWATIPLIRHHAVRLGRREHSFHQTHKTAVPRLGGIALASALIVLAMGAATLWHFDIRPTEWVIVLGALAMFGLGLIDDIRPLGARIKLVAQALISIVVYLGGLQIENFTNPFTNVIEPIGMSGFVATVFWLVAMTNLINLIDGIDGLAGGVAFMLMCLLACVGLDTENFSFLVSVGIAGALIAFICFNFPPAKIYLGDGGAYFLGFLIGMLTIQNSQKGTVAAALIAPIFALALPIVDVSWAIVRRGLKGLPIFRPDRHHIHHHLMACGRSHRRTVLILYAFTMAFTMAAFAVFWSQGRLVPILFGFVFLTIVVSARSLGFVQDWFSVGRLLGSTAQMRKETRYALVLSRWLELEAERCKTAEELWRGFVFLAWKLGFSEVKLALEDGEIAWSSGEAMGDELPRQRHDLQIGNITSIEFAMEASVMPARVFEQLAELAAEAWTKSALRWQTVNQGSIRLQPDWVAPLLPGVLIRGESRNPVAHRPAPIG